MEELIALMQAEVKTLEDEHQEEARQAREVRMQELSMELQISLEQLEKKQAMLEALLALEGQEPDARGYIEQWAQAFCNRDAVTIIRLANERVEEKLTNSDLLVHSFADGKDYAGFGWSSPWPWGNGDSYDEAAPAPNYRIVNVTDRSAEILYYAWVSNPHVTVWRELLTFSTENDEFVITSETLEYMDSICTAEQFYQAYPNGVISGTMMDYYEYNGAGEALNNNAKEGRESGDLFIADKAALYLLNASGSTRINLTEDKSICVVRITFGDKSSVDVTMIQPYGEDGIWIPWSDGEPQDMSSGGAGSYTINSQNIDSIRREDAARLEALFPDHHESRTVSGYVDLNGDGDMEKVELTDLRYNGGDGGYALTVTDGKTGKEIPLPAGYTQESGFPLQAIYVQPRRELAILMGEEYPKRMLVSISEGALLDIYERKGMYQEIKRSLNSSVGDLRVDALSGCSITCIGEENPVLVLKSYVSGFMGHADTLGYVITELRLQKDNTWEEKSYFLLDSCAEQITQNTAVEKEAVGGFRNLPFQSDTDIKIVQLQ